MGRTVVDPVTVIFWTAVAGAVGVGVPGAGPPFPVQPLTRRAAITRQPVRKIETIIGDFLDFIHSPLSEVPRIKYIDDRLKI
jgi:hypothetical protein